MEQLLLYFVLGPFYLALDLAYMTGLVDGSADNVRMVVAALGTAFYATLVGYGI